MNVELLHWFAAGGLLIGALLSIFTPENTMCPIDLPPRTRAAIAVVLGALQAMLHSMTTGVPWYNAVMTAVATIVVALCATGTSALDHHTADNTPTGDTNNDQK